MICPKKEILASLIYIQRHINEGNVLLNKDTAKIVSDSILKQFQNVLNNVKKAEMNKENSFVPLSLNMYAKSIFYTVNYLKDIKFLKENINEKINLYKNKDFKYDKTYKNFDEIDNKNLTINFGDKDKIYMLDFFEIRDKFKYTNDNKESVEKEMIDSLVYLIDRIKITKGYESLNLNEDRKFYNIKQIIALVLKEIQGAIRDNKLKKEPLFYIKDTEIKIPFLKKEDIEEILTKVINAEMSDELVSKHLLAKVLKNDFDEIKDNFVNILFSYLKNSINENTTDSLLPLINGEKSFISKNIPYFLSEYETILKLNNTIEFKSSIENKTVLLPNLVKEKEKENADYKPFIELDFYKEETDNDFPVKKQKKSLNVDKMIYVFDFKKKILDVKNIEFKENVNNIYDTNTSQNVSFYIKDNFSKDKFHTAIIDEVDKGTSGKINNILREITAGEGKQITIASGSPITARARDLVPLIAFGGENVDIKENEKNFTVQCGYFELKNEYDALIFNSVRDSQNIANYFINTANEYISNKKNKKQTFNEINYFFQKADELFKLVGYEDINLNMDKVDIFKLSRALNKIISHISKDPDLLRSASLTDSLIKVFLKNNKSYLKEVPEISNPKSLISLITSIGNPNSSIMTREKLKNRKEHIEITDKEVFLNTIEKIEKNGISIEEFEENNDLSIKLLQLGLNYLNMNYFIPQSEEYLKNLFKDFTNMFLNDKKQKENLESLSKLLQIDLNDIKSYLSKTTISGNDDINSIYSLYLKYNGDMDKINDKFVKDDYSNEKINFFTKFMKVFDVYFKALSSFSEQQSYNILNINGESFIKSGGYKYQAVFKVGDNEFPTDKLATEDGYPKELGIMFSTDIELTKDEYKQFLKPLKEDGREWYLKYNLEFTNQSENTVLDVRGSKGIEKEIEENLNSGKSVVISSARIAGLVFNILDTLYAAQFRNNKETPLSIIVNETSSLKDFNLKNILSRIDEKYLKDNNIVITPVKRNMLDAQVKLDSKKGYQIALLSNYESISRGLDLSMLDKIIATGSMTKGKEFIQYIARLFSVDKDTAEFSLFHGGQDAELFVPKLDILDNYKNTIIRGVMTGEFSKEDVENILNNNSDEIFFKSTQTSKIQLDSYKKLNLYQLFMSGEKTNIIDNDKKIKCLVTLTDNSDIKKELKTVDVNNNIKKRM